jgi:polysaccharide pyruvyl transferase WcaK-like protein
VTIFENVGPFVGSTDDDSIATEFLKNQFGDSLQYLRPNTLFEAKQSLKTFEVVVAARMHACLNALAVGTPTIALAYSRKFSPIFGDLGWPIVLDLRDTEFFATEVLSLIPEVALRTLEARRVHGVALRQLESAEPKIRQWLAESQIHSTPSGSQ